MSGITLRTFEIFIGNYPIIDKIDNQPTKQKIKTLVLFHVWSLTKKNSGLFNNDDDGNQSIILRS